MSLSQYSRLLRRIFQILLVLLPIGMVYFWLTAGTPSDYLTRTGVVQLYIPIDSLTSSPLAMKIRLSAMLASAIYALILVRALCLLISLFRHYEMGEIFSERNVKIFRQLGRSIFYWIFGGVLYHTLMSIIISYNNPPGHRMLMVTFSGIDFLSLLVGGIILGIARVMQEGLKLADESELTI